MMVSFSSADNMVRVVLDLSSLSDNARTLLTNALSDGAEPGALRRLREMDDLDPALSRILNNDAHFQRLENLPRAQAEFDRFHNALMDGLQNGTTSYETYSDQVIQMLGLHGDHAANVQNDMRQIAERFEADIARRTADGTSRADALAAYRTDWAARTGADAEPAGASATARTAPEDDGASSEGPYVDPYAARAAGFNLHAKAYSALGRMADSMIQSDNALVRFAGRSAGAAAGSVLYAPLVLATGGTIAAGAHLLTDGASTEAGANAAYSVGEHLASAVAMLPEPIQAFLEDSGTKVLHATAVVWGVPTDINKGIIQTFADRSGIELDENQALAAAQLISSNPLALLSIAAVDEDGFSEDDITAYIVEAQQSGNPTEFFAQSMGISSDEYNRSNNAMLVGLEADARAAGLDPDLVSAYVPDTHARDGSNAGDIASTLAMQRDEDGNIIAPGTSSRVVADRNLADVMRNLTGIDTTGLRLQDNLEDWSGSAVSNAFGLAQDHSSRLDLGFGFTIASMAVGFLSSIFGQESWLVQGAQRWALDTFNVDEKLAGLQEDVANGNFAELGVSQGRFDMALGALSLLGPQEEPEAEPT